MSQGPLCPNLTKKFQKKVFQIANHNLSCVILLGGLSVNLNHLKKSKILKKKYAKWSKPHGSASNLVILIVTENVLLSNYKILTYEVLADNAHSCTLIIAC